VDATHNAIVAVTNGGNRATEALLTLHFDDGRKTYEIQQTIRPGEQMWLNFADLIHHSVPDRKGKVLPAEVTAGTYDLEDLNPGLAGNLIEGKVALDKTWGHLAHGCLQCCGYTPYLNPDPAAVAVGNFVGIQSLGQNNCTGRNGYDLTTYFSSMYASWWSGNSGIAQVTSFQGKGMAAGTTIGNARGYMVPSGDGGPYKQCPAGPQQTQNQVPVFKFQISGNAFIFVGTDPNIVSANSYYATNGSGGSPQPAGGILSATSSDSKDTFQITQGNLPVAKVSTSDQSANNLDRTLTFKYALSGGDSVSQLMKVTARQFAWDTNNNPNNVCTLGYGTDLTYTYTVYTHPDKTAVDGNSGLSGTPVTEAFNPAIGCGTVTGGGSLNTNGQFTDHVASICSSTPLTCSLTTTQTLSVAGYQVRQNQLVFSTTGVSYTNKGPFQ
jgi:hypothetical protein